MNEMQQGARVLFSGGLAGTIEGRPMASVCCYCEPHHPISDIDRQIIEQQPEGTPVSHGMCQAAFERVMAEDGERQLARGAGEDL